jgi:uncharacterized protein (DUF433 family)
MRITVYDVLSYLASGMSVPEILDDFPYLTADDIQACLAFAAEREWGSGSARIVIQKFCGLLARSSVR